MTDITFFDAPVVELVDHMGDDHSIVRSARVSVKGADHEHLDPNATDFLPKKRALVKSDSGLINYLLREKHGSPFEHTSMTFYVKAPIFVFREFHRHRVGFSYNEMSGRYTELLPEFYLPSTERPLVNIGTSSAPKMAPADPDVVSSTRLVTQVAYENAWGHYQALLGLGIAKEVARVVLPVGIMSQMYVTCNARSLMNFLSLRTHDERAAHVSRPQYEIEQVAIRMEKEFARLFPETWRRYNEHGRVAP